jgi:hypothetical protein
VSRTTPSTTSDTLLDFIPSLAPDPPQMSDSLRLRFSVDKRPGSPVFCKKIRIAYGVDEACTDAGALTCKTDKITPTADPDKDWNCLCPQGGLYLFMPKTPGGELTRNYVFEIDDIEVSSVLGAATVTVTETATDHDAAHCTNADHSACYQDRVATYPVPKFPADFGEVSFKADRSFLAPGGSVTLTWEGDKSGIYTLTQNDEPVDPSKIVASYGSGPRGEWMYTSPALDDDTAFTLSAAPKTDKTLTREYYIAVLVGSMKLSLGVAKGGSSTILEGQSVPLTWDIAHVSSCQIMVEGDDEPAYTIGTASPPWSATPSETSTYYLSGVSQATGGSFSSNPLPIQVVAKMAAVTPDLVFIKTATADNVEIQVAAGKSGFQESSHTEKTCFDSAERPNGTWQIARYTEMDPPSLLLIRTSGTDPCVKLWVDYRHVGDGLPAWQVPTSFPLWMSGNGIWQAIPMNPDIVNDALDLVLIQTANTDMVHVQYATARNSYNIPHRDLPTCFTPNDARNGTFLMADMGSHGRPADLVFIQTANTASKHVELSYATGASGYKQKGGHWVTDFKTADAAKGIWMLADMDADGVPDLVFVQTAATVSKRIEVYYALASEDYKSDDPILGGYTMFDLAEGPNGTWQVVPYPLGR